MHHHETFPAVFVKGKLVRTRSSSASPKMSRVHRWAVATTPMRNGRLGKSRRCLRIEFYAPRACVCTRQLSGNMNNCAFMNFYFPAHLCGGRVASPQKLETFRAFTTPPKPNTGKIRRTCTATSSRWPQCGTRCGMNCMAGTDTGRATQDAAASPRPNTTAGPAGSAPGCEGGMLLPAFFALVALCPVVRACLSARGHVMGVRDAAESVSAPEEGAPEQSTLTSRITEVRSGCRVTSQNPLILTFCALWQEEM